MLVIGRLHPKKRLEMLLDVFLELTRTSKFQQWRLVVAGDGEADYVASLKWFVSVRDGTTDCVPGVARRDRQGRRAAWAAVLALLSAQENFGIVVAEALACGTPVLVSTHVNLADEITAANAGVVSLWSAPTF